ELGEQIDTVNKMKAKAEKDKANMERDLQEARSSLDESMREPYHTPTVWLSPSTDSIEFLRSTEFTDMRWYNRELSIQN
ncbi:MAG: hypothetical protein AAGG44_15715, partial [Planctomycetota bacterium]